MIWFLLLRNCLLFRPPGFDLYVYDTEVLLCMDDTEVAAAIATSTELDDVEPRSSPLTARHDTSPWPIQVT